MNEVKRRTDSEQKAGEQYVAELSKRERELQESKAERTKVEDALLKAEETYRTDTAELNQKIEKKATEARDNYQALQAMVTR